MFFHRLVIIFVISIAAISSARAVIDSFESGKYDESFRLAYSKALNGDASAQYIVGRILYEGLGAATRDVDLAKDWMTRSIKVMGELPNILVSNYQKKGLKKALVVRG